MARDSHGGSVVTWSTRATVWGSVSALSHRESVMAGQLTGELKSAVLIRYRSDVDITDRIIVIGSATRADRTLQIESYQDPTGERVELRLLCAEVQA